MNNWKTVRNYRRVRDENGGVTAYIITVDGQDVEVSEEVFVYYARMERHEVYVEWRDSRKLVSLDLLRERHVPVESLSADPAPGFEEALLDSDEEEQILAAIERFIPSLDEEERQMLLALWVEGCSLREFARRKGLHHSTVQERRDKLLVKLRRINR